MLPSVQTKPRRYGEGLNREELMIARIEQILYINKDIEMITDPLLTSHVNRRVWISEQRLFDHISIDVTVKGSSV